jgi:peroxiredoxin
MSKVELHTVAPDFELPDFTGKPFRLGDQSGQSRVLLVFNRGFT